jgi:hypothetical protein
LKKSCKVRNFKVKSQEIGRDESQNQKWIPAQSVPTLRAGVRMAQEMGSRLGKG